MIANNVFNPGVVNETIYNADTEVSPKHVVDINSGNFESYIISSADAANNATNHWLTLSGNTFGE